MTRFRNALLVLIAVAVGAGLLAPAGPAEAQKRGGTLTIVRPTDPVSLEPNLETTAPGAWVYFNMLEGLLTLDTKMQVQPSLATSYEVMSPTRVRFKLRPNVKFHDGTPLNAAAVKFTFDRALKGTPPARWASLAGSLDGAEVVDDLTVDIVTPRALRPGPAHARDVLHGHRLADRGAEAGRGLQPGAGGHRAVQVRGVEDQHPRDHRAQSRTTGATRRCSTA